MVCEYSTVEPPKNGLGFSGPRFIWSLLGSWKSETACFPMARKRLNTTCK